MKKITKILLAILTGVLLSPAYFQWGTGFMMFFALIPLLLVEDDLYKRRKDLKTKNIFWYPVISFMLFTLLTVWWVKNSVAVGLVAALFVNTAFMVVPFLLFHYVKRNTNPRIGYLSLIALWISFEYLFLNVQVNFPWTIFGNAFATDIKFIQWYDITGAMGGSLWVLVMNILLFELFVGLRKKFSFIANRSKISWAFGVLIVPVIFSLIRFYTYEEEDRPYECVVLQPNIDPWSKFQAPQDQQTAYLLDEARKLTTESTDYIIGPETFINNNVWHATLNVHTELNKLYQFMEPYPDAKFIIGAMTYKRYAKGDSLSSTAKPLGKSEFFFDSYNSALQLDESRNIQMYHKSLLVTGAEWMPAFNKLKIMQKLAIDLGGITRSHGTQEERSTFVSPQDGLRVAPVICWESIFGEYVTKYVKDKGANLIFVITNDGWWKDTPGHRQHNSFSHLRAIETRRSIARSANTGISCLINQRGEEIARIAYNERSGIKGILNANDHLTFYVKHGDYIARISAFLSVLLVLYAFVRIHSVMDKPKRKPRKTKK
ncbi:MAG: apolipoprotein N-acyltransferase [Spirochaetales bacterium]|jgi:apolipoprotein N-acyltransferase|nr:apolipoprotein N-acyltransferase [Spirochaetales bacterium]